MPKVELPKKNIPQSAQPLKSFNWSKLPDMKVEGTVWKELDETKWYNSMDLESIDKLFSAYQKANGVAVCRCNKCQLLHNFITFSSYTE